MTNWSITVKTVGSADTSGSATATASAVAEASILNRSNHGKNMGFENSKLDQKVQGDGAAQQLCKEPSPSTFTVQLDNESPLSELHTLIENITGLKSYQQRLIYRGRILPVCDPPMNKVAIIQSEQSHDESASQECAPTPNQGSSSLVAGNNKISLENCQVIRLCDIQGLDDGHTIHLVPRRSAKPPQSHPPEVDSVVTNDENETDNSTASSLLSAILGLGGGGGSINSNGNVTVINAGGGDEDLTTLSGLSTLLRRMDSGSSGVTAQASGSARRSMLNSRNSRNQRANTIAAARGLVNPVAVAATNSASPARSAQQQGAGTAPHRRQRGYRDGVPPIREAGSLEPVRQGIMTLNTLLRAHRDAGDAVTADTSCRRTFYKGQWVDVKDTVNQWLEATILDIASPADVLGTEEFQLLLEKDLSYTILGEVERKHMLDRMPVVSASDMEGRRSLLLKSTPAEIVNPSLEHMNLNDSIDTATTPPPPRPVESLFPFSTDVQLLKVHYNGWPHRWDEWIRSDSHRIRPFRTRTRHSSSVPYASPTIHSSYEDTPLTFVRSQHDDALEREAVIQELGTVLSEANDYMRRVTAGFPVINTCQQDGLFDQSTVSGTESTEGSVLESTRDSEEASESDGESEEAKEPEPQDVLHPRDDRLLPWKKSMSHQECKNDNETTAIQDQSFLSTPHRTTTRQDLQGLASLIDRLGRTLTDIAPHVALLATELPDPKSSDLSGTCMSNTPSNVTSDARYTVHEVDQNRSEITSSRGDYDANDTSNGLIPNSVDESDASSPLLISVIDAMPTQPPLEHQNESVDFVNSMVHARSASATPVSAYAGNTNERRSSRARDRAAAFASFLANSGSNGTSTLAAALAGDGISNDTGDEGGSSSDGEGTPNNLTSNLARLFGSGGNGIDIHIHAIVTPGFGPGGIVFGGLPGLDTGFVTASEEVTNANSVSASNVTLNQIENEDDMGLFDSFDELYGEPVRQRHATSYINYDAEGAGEEAETLAVPVPINSTPAILTAVPAEAEAVWELTSRVD